MATQFLSLKKSLPVLGVGIGLRREIAAETLEHCQSIDWLEYTPENYMGIGGAAPLQLEKAASIYTVVSHGVNLSIGSTDEVNRDYLKSVRSLAHRLKAPWWSDHLCFSSVEGKYLHDLYPLPLSREAVRHVVPRIKMAQQYVEKPFLIENISYYEPMPGAEMSEAQFIAEILEQADCGLLLDVNNLYVNAINHGFDPEQFLSEIPLERIVQIHVAGHKRYYDQVIDTHGEAISEPVYQLLERVLKMADVNGVMIERDQNFPPFEELLQELESLRAVVNRCRAFGAEAAAGQRSPAQAPVSITAVRNPEPQQPEAPPARLRELERSFVTSILSLPASQAHCPRKDTPDYASNLYSWLFNGARQGVMRSIYPLCSRLLAANWTPLVNGYLERHRSTDLNLNKTGERFGEYVTTHGGELLKQMPFLPELVDIEWQQLLISQSTAEDVIGNYTSPTTTEELNNYGPVPNPVLVLRDYQYPLLEIVARIRKGVSLPERIRPDTTYVAIFRDPETRRCQMVQLSYVVARAVSASQEPAVSYARLIETIAPLSRHTDNVEAIVAVLEMVDKLQTMRIFVGSTPVPAAAIAAPGAQE